MPVMSSDRVLVNRLVSAARRWAYASAPTAVAWNVPVPATTIDPESTWSCWSLVHGIGLPGEQRLVDLQAVGLDDLTVSGHLIAGPQSDQVVEHDLADGPLLLGAVAHHGGRRCVQHGEAIERPLRSQLLHDPDQRVPDDHQTEQGIGGRADGQHGDEQHAEDGVEAGEDVGPDDGLQGPAGLLLDLVDLAGRDSLGDLGDRETAGRCDGGDQAYDRGRVPATTPRLGVPPRYRPERREVRASPTPFSRTPVPIPATGSRENPLPR